MDDKIRINKYLSQAGFCSRREADKYIIDERVTINGAIAQMGEKIDLEDTIAVDVEKISKKIKTFQTSQTISKKSQIPQTSNKYQSISKNIKNITYIKNI